MGEIRGLNWQGRSLLILDQTRLPLEEHYQECRVWPDVVEAIQGMRVRGAPAIGLAGAYAVALACLEYANLESVEFHSRLTVAAETIVAARPTAVNLAVTVQRVLEAARAASSVRESIESVITEAQSIDSMDLEANYRIGAWGATLLPDDSTVLTHCNTGALATSGYGTALGIIRKLWTDERLRRVVATETRPLLQGSRITAWELSREGIPVTIVVDGAVGYLLQQGQVDAILVGADRIAANGDVANKIGTYSLAVLGRVHHVPFYVAAPSTTIDLNSPDGDTIPIEMRDGAEIASFNRTPTGSESVAVYNPGFDITPSTYVDAIITEVGIARHPYNASLREMVSSHD